MLNETKKKKKAEVSINEEKCKGCGNCIQNCPFKLLRYSNAFNLKGYNIAEFFDPDLKCPACGTCYLVCPDCAIEIYSYVEK